MNPHAKNVPSSVRPEAAFNLVEVALALGIVAFALTAIMGVLPAGVNVQRDNRAETIINYDARYWMEAIRSGQMPLSFNYNPDGSANSVKEWQAVSHSALTNHVYWVRVERPTGTNTFTYANQSDWPESVIGRLSFPDSLVDVIPVESGLKKIAKVRSLTGRLGNAAADAGFYYFLETSIIPASTSPYLASNLFQLRLTFKWPVIMDATGTSEVTGTGSKTFSTLVSGTLFGGYSNTDPARKVGEDWIRQLPSNVNDYSRRLYYFRPTMFEPFK